jgi:hypothetical protein
MYRGEILVYTVGSIEYWQGFYPGQRYFLVSLIVYFRGWVLSFVVLIKELRTDTRLSWFELTQENKVE